MKEGDKNHPVETLQYLLSAHGGTVNVDGIFGVRTDAEVRTFQGSKGLTVDGLGGTHRRPSHLASADQRDALALRHLPVIWP